VTPVAQELLLISGLKLRIDEPLSRYTSLKVGGPADLLLEIHCLSALSHCLRLLKHYAVPAYLLGKGSNVLVSDRGVRGAVLRLSGDFKRFEWRQQNDAATLIVGAACPVAQLAREAVRRAYAGLEFAEGIPGTVGGAIVMNAGAYGSEIDQVVARVEGLTRQGEERVFAREELSFTYRATRLPRGFIVTRVWFGLSRGIKEALQQRLRELTRRRKQSQPGGRPNAGSMFKNPPGDFAGRLIEAADLKGKRVGRAEISTRHANFIVNLGGASAQDVKQLMDLARSEVQARFGVELTPEVRFVGDWLHSTEVR
jgi:UDP-N-acetylmuramate dehydrogenase